MRFPDADIKAPAYSAARSAENVPIRQIDSAPESLCGGLLNSLPVSIVPRR